MRENRDISYEQRKKRSDKEKIELNKRLNFLLFFTGTILIIFIFQFIFQRKKILELKNKSQMLTQEYNNLEKKIEVLKGDLDKANSLDYIEKIAREKLGMIKDNEKIYVPSDELNSSEDQQKKEEDKREDQNGNQESRDNR